MNLVSLVKENRLLKLVYSNLVKIVEVVPFYLFEEGIREKKLDLQPSLQNFIVCFLDSSDIKIISSHDEVPEAEDELLERLSNGCLCLGIKVDNNIAAYTWCNLEYCDYGERLSFELKEDEAYLFDARTFRDYRGKSIAPFLRYKFYEELEKLGRSKFYSFTSTLNTSALKFKEKLLAIITKKYVYIRIFNKVKFTFLLTKYPVV